MMKHILGINIVISKCMKCEMKEIDLIIFNNQNFLHTSMLVFVRNDNDASNNIL